MKTMYKASTRYWDILPVEQCEVDGELVRESHSCTFTNTITQVVTASTYTQKFPIETDWYKYCSTKAEAKQWLLIKAQKQKLILHDKLQRQVDDIARILEIEVLND